MKLFSFFVNILFILPVFSQTDGAYGKYIYYNKENGLSENTIMAIEKDELGFMWIGTRNGLNKFDGERFTVFRNQASDSIGLDDSYVLSLRKDSNGVIWIGTRRGINRYDPKTKKITRLSNTEIKGSNPSKIKIICKVSEQSIWFASDKNIFVFNKNSNVLKTAKVLGISDEIKGLIQFHAIFKDSKNLIWVGTNRGLYRGVQINDDTISLIEVNKKECCDHAKINVITEDKNGDLWLGTDKNGLLRYDISSNRLKESDKKIPITLDIRDLTFDKDQNLWIACFKGLVILKNDGTIVNPKNLNKRGKIISDGLTTVFADDQGSIWIGGYFGGVRLWNKDFDRFKIVSSLHPKIDLDLGLVNAIAEDKKGLIYIGTKKNGIVVLNKNKSINYQLTSLLTKELLDITVKGFLIDKNLLWIATLKNGVLVYDTVKHKFLSGLIEEELQKSLRLTKLYSVAKLDNVLVLGTYGAGIFIYDLTNRQVANISYSAKVANNDSATLGNVTLLHFDTRKNLWIGSLTGLKRITATNFEKRKYVIERFNLSENPSGMNVRTIFENSNGELIIGGRGPAYMYKEDEFKKIDFSNYGIDINKIYSVVNDHKDMLWAATDTGIIRYHPDSETINLFDHKSSLLTSEFREHSFLKSKDGTIFLGTSTGVIYFAPDEITFDKHESKVLLTAIQIQDEETSTVNSTISQTQLETKSGISLSHNQNSFTIQFSSFNFTKILSNSYEYRLLGLNDSWKTTSNPEVTYTLQKSGDYIFEVRKAELSGFGTNEITSLPIYVMAAPWKSWYAILFYIFLFLSLIFLVFRVMKSKTELKHRLALENLEKRNEKERYISQIEFFTNLSHDFRTPLTLILAPLNQLIEKYSGGSSTYKSLLGIQRNADHLLVLINQLLDFRKIDNRNSKLICTKNDIVQSLRTIFLSFKEFSDLGEYTYSMSSPKEHLYLYYNSFMIERVFYNLISNAFKNTPKGGTVEILIEDNEEEVMIKVIDSGTGIDQKVIDGIFDRFYSSVDKPSFKKEFSNGTGIGLHIAKKAINIHKGTINVRSTKDIGSTFSVCLRKGTKHLSDHIIKEDEIQISGWHRPNTTTEITINEKEVEFLKEEKINTIEKPTILVVEDNDEIRKYLLDILKDFFRVEQAINGRKGFNKALQKNVDLIVSDIMMPDMDGNELCNKVKNDERTCHIPVILLTSRSSDAHQIEGLESGADAYITKPFAVKQLLLIINNILATHHHSKKRYDVVYTKYDDSKNKEITTEDEKLYNRAMEIVKDNFHNSSFEVKELCAQLGVNRTKLYKKMKEWTGQTPKEYIQFVRLKKASQLLERGDLNISSICYEVGFASTHYFAKCFKKQFKQTPTEYASKFHHNP